MAVLSDEMRVADMYPCFAAAQPDNLFSISFRVTHCHKVTHFSTDLPQLSTYVFYYLIKVLRCEGRVVRSVNFLLTHTVCVYMCVVSYVLCVYASVHLYAGVYMRSCVCCMWFFICVLTAMFSEVTRYLVHSQLQFLSL